MMEKSPFQRYIESRKRDVEMEADIAKVAKALNDYKNTGKTPEDRANLFRELEDNELGSRDAATWWFRRANALRRAIGLYEHSKGELKDVTALNDELESICIEQTPQMSIAKNCDVDHPMYEVHQRSYTKLMLEELSKELAVTGVNTDLTFKPTTTGFHEQGMMGGLRRGELILNHVNVRSHVSLTSLCRSQASGGPVLRIIDEKHYPSDHDGNVAFMPGTVNKTLQGKAMLGDKLTDAAGGNSSGQYEVRRLLEDDYEPPQVESCDDVPIDQNPNYRQLNGPGKPKNHIRRGRVSDLFENLFSRSTSTSKK